jgi:transposase
MKCNENGIIVEFIDEKYTSKCSCLTDDVNNPLDNELNGVRSKRGLLLDKKLNKIWNCDINGAVNHIKKYDKDKNFDWLINNFYKLANPIKIKSDYDFIKFMNNVSDKVSLI